MENHNKVTDSEAMTAHVSLCAAALAGGEVGRDRRLNGDDLLDLLGGQPSALHQGDSQRVPVSHADLAVSRDAEAGAQDLGVKLRRRRKAQGLTMQQVATAAGLSVGFISQVERGLAAPSLSSLAGIAAALSAPIHAFLQYPATCDDLTRAADRTLIGFPAAAGRRYERLSTTFPGSTLRAVLVYQPPGPRCLPATHEGEEIILVLRGAMTIELDGTSTVLAEGDSAHFSSSRPHCCWNHTQTESTLLWCCTMDLFGDAVTA